MTRFNPRVNILTEFNPKVAVRLEVLGTGYLHLNILWCCTSVCDGSVGVRVLIWRRGTLRGGIARSLRMRMPLARPKSTHHTVYIGSSPPFHRCYRLQNPTHTHVGAGWRRGRGGLKRRGEVCNCSKNRATFYTKEPFVEIRLKVRQRRIVLRLARYRPIANGSSPITRRVR